MAAHMVSSDGAPLQPFNMATMSGVFPGTRTRVWQRVRLMPLAGSQPPAGWALLLWYDEPAACVLVPQESEPTHRPAAPPSPPAPLARIEAPNARTLHARLTEALAEQGARIDACGGCAHWRVASSEGGDVRTTADGLALGACALRREGGPMSEAEAVPAVLAAQSHLSLACAHWQPRAQSPAAAVEAAPDADATLPVAPLPKIAETTESKLKPLARLRLRIARSLRPPPPPANLAAMLAERSGVGAGTEPCPVCQGRIANLGALTVASPEGDKETFSVWRCRVCHTLFLSDWVDRWERVESLETEERIYRIAPVEAAELLTLFATIPAAEHPERRHERTAQRVWIHEQLALRTPLSHTIKQGR